MKANNCSMQLPVAIDSRVCCSVLPPFFCIWLAVACCMGKCPENVTNMWLNVTASMFQGGDRSKLGQSLCGRSKIPLILSCWHLLYFFFNFLALDTFCRPEIGTLRVRVKKRPHSINAWTNLTSIRNIASFWSPNIHFITIMGPFIKLCTKHVHNTMKHTQHVTKRSKIQIFRSKETDLNDLGTNPKQ